MRYTANNMIDTAVFKTMLEDELKVVTNELQSLGVRNPMVSSDWIPVAEDGGSTEADDNVLADKYEDLATREGIVADLEARFNNINRALAKIENGTYGVCELGGETIEQDRLAANPAARTCKAHIESESELSQ